MDNLTQLCNLTTENTTDSSTATSAAWASFWVFCSVCLIITVITAFYDDYQYKKGNKQRYDGVRPDSHYAV